MTETVMIAIATAVVVVMAIFAFLWEYGFFSSKDEENTSVQEKKKSTDK